MISAPPAEVRAHGFRHEVAWTLRHNWAWYSALAVVCFLLGHFV